VAFQALKIGILADSSVQLGDLMLLVKSAGYQIVATIHATRDKLNHQLPTVEAWIVRLDMQNDLAMRFVEKLDGLDVPVIYDDYEDSVGSDKIERIKRFAGKINMCTAQGASSPLNQSRAREVWVLAASAGGPEAVIEFLKVLPDSMTNAAFLYVQHIDSAIAESLYKAIMRNTTWQVFNTDKSHFVSERCIYIVSPGHAIDINGSGLLNPIQEQWAGPFKPSIDQVMIKVAHVYGEKSGAIIFSGMGNDGAKGCQYMKHSGGQVWAQSPDSCMIDSMPASALKTGCVTVQGTPKELARQFVAIHGGFQAAGIPSREPDKVNREVKV